MIRSLSCAGLVDKENLQGLRNTLHTHLDAKETAVRNYCTVAETAGRPRGQVFTGMDASVFDNILAHLKAGAEGEWRPASDYMALQTDVDAKMRAILVDWLVDVTCKFKMLPQTIFITVALIDRFLAAVRISHKRLQLVGVAALMIAAKYEEIYPPPLADYVTVCCNIYTAPEVLAMESEILLSVGFELNKPVSFVLLEFLRVQARLEDKAFVFAQYFLEAALLDVAHLRHSPLELAAGAVYLANKLLKRPAWDASLAAGASVGEATARAAASTLFTALQQIERSALRAVTRKYQSPQFFCIAKFRIERVSLDASKRPF